MKMNGLDMLTWVLVIIGGLNWGLVGFFHFNLVNTIFGGMPMVERVIYDLVGISAVYMLLMAGKMMSSNK